MAHLVSSDRINRIVKDLADELDKSRPLTFLNRVNVTSTADGIMATYTAPVQVEKEIEPIVDTTLIDWLDSL